MSFKRTLLAAAASVFGFALSGAAVADPAPLPAGPVPLSNSDFYSGLQAFGNFEDFGAFNDYNRGRNTSVMQRERPEYSAAGLPVSSFIFYPRITSGLGYTDNVFATQSNKFADEYTEIDPNLVIQSIWSRNSLNIDMGGAFRVFDHKHSENEDGGHIRAVSRIDLVGDSFALVGGDVQRTYEARTDGGAPSNAAAALPYTTYGVFGRGVYQAGRVRASGSVDFRGFDWDNVPQIGGGFIDQRYRDETVTTVSGRGEYAPTPDTGVFGELAYVLSDYRDVVGIPTRSSSEYRALGGADFDLTALIRGEIGGGYVDREYDSSAYGSISGFAVRGQVEYFPSPLTTLTMNLSRSIQDAVILNSGGYFSNLVGLKVDHELLRNLLINGAITYEYDDYDQIKRTDKIGNLKIGFQYLLSRGVGINASYSYAKRESRADPTVIGPQFNTNRLFVGLVLQR